MAAVGRNDPCPCGSGKKYKKCHLPLEEAQRWPVNEETILADHDRRPTIQTLWSHANKRARAVGSGVFLRPPTETFSEFLWNLVKWTFGKEWWLAECAKSPSERHQIVRWAYDLAEWQKANWETAKVYGRMRGAAPSGAVQALTTFGYDLYTLRHAMRLADRLVERLRDRREFQGARYELAVAALVLRAGFDIEWTREKDADPHCEFIASDPSHRFGVEAKSRRRKGVLHEAGALDEATVVQGDVQGLFEKASAQSPEGIPFVIFIDLNCPPTPDAAAFPLRASWWAGLSSTLETYGAIVEGTESQLAVFNALVITNFSTHYFGQDEASTTGERLMIRTQHPQHVLDNAVLARLWEGVRRYGSFPIDPPDPLST